MSGYRAMQNVTRREAVETLRMSPDSVKRWWEAKHIQLTRGRPYKKDDNAHIEQKNWTYVRKLLGWERYDSPVVVAAINDLYCGELRLW